MKVLFLSNLFPDAAQPNRGIYNGRLAHRLAPHCELRVIAPRPTRGFPPFWSPQEYRCRPEDAAFAPVYPPASYIPKVGSRWNHRLMARSLRAPLRAVRAEFPFDIVLAAWAYPDACAVAQLAAEMDFPFVAFPQGSDIHQYLSNPVRRRIITAAMHQAGAIVTPSQELARLLREVGVPGEKLHPIYNGVEREVFHPGDRAAARAALKLAADETILLFVGNFLPIKNPLLLVDAFKELVRREPAQKFRLVMLGDGPLGGAIQSRVQAAGLGERVSLPGRKPPGDVARFMQAADLLVVPSNNEGVPNVIYEAMSCGLRTVATHVGGIPEIVTADFLGRLVPPQNPPALAEAMASVLAAIPVRENITAHARQFSWERTAAEHLRVLSAVLGNTNPPYGIPFPTV